MQVSTYRRNIDGKIRLIAHTTLEQLFRRVSEHTIKELFSNNIEDRANTGNLSWDSLARYYPPSREIVTSGAFVVYDEKDRVVTVDRLIGLYRVVPKRKKYWSRWTNRFSGRKRKSGSWLRYMKTTQEIRWRDAWDDEDVVVNYRRRAGLPDAWDDFRVGRRGDGWKNYRKTQWKN